MLQIKAESINLSASIKVGDNEVIQVYRQINADGSFGSNAQSIIDTKLYAQNMEDCRKDREQFETLCQDIQDKLIMGTLIDSEHIDVK